MKLYLSSYSFGKHIDRLHELVGDNKTVLFIDNAKDELSSIDRQAHVAEKQAEWQRAGFEFEELDLRDFFDDNSGLEDKLESVGLVWGSGGNSFVLRRAMRYSGLDELLVKHLSNGRLAYGGSSAGSIVVTPSLHGTERGDDPYLVPTGYQKPIVWEGLNIIPQFIVPHIESPWFEESMAMEQYMKENDNPYIALRDGEVYVVNGDEAEHLR